MSCNSAPPALVTAWEPLCSSTARQNTSENCLEAGWLVVGFVLGIAFYAKAALPRVVNPVPREEMS